MNNEAQILKDMIAAQTDNYESELLYIAHLVGEHIELPCKTIYEKYDIPNISNDLI